MNPGREERTMADASINMSSVALATTAAGPLFLLGIGIGSWIDDPGATADIGQVVAIAPMIAVIAVFASFFGTIIALIPNFIGAAIMIWLGNRNEAARLPLLWAMAGALACAVPVMAIEAGSPGRSAETLVAFTFTGACCALICRRRIQW